MEVKSHTRNIYLAVLPLQQLTDDPKVEMFCQGLVMDLITDLSRFRPFQIIAYETARGILPEEMPGSKALDALDLDYLIKGMARRQGDKLVLNLQLVHVPENRLVWAEKFSGGFETLFHIQENIVEKIATTLQQFVDHDILNEIRKKPLTSLSAYECWLRGYQELKKGTLEADVKARTCFQQAMEKDPHYARAFTGMSLSYFNEWSCQLWNRWEVSQTGAFEWAQRALELDEWDHVSNAILGRLYLFNGDYDQSEHYLRKSLRINPNDAETVLLIAVGFTYLGYLFEAEALYKRAKRLNPAHNFAATGAFIYFEMGQFEKSTALGEKHELGKGWVDFPAYQAAGYYLRGDLQKSRECWEIYLDAFSQKINGGVPADTQTALEWMINVNPYREKTQLLPFWEYIGDKSFGELAPGPSKPVSLNSNRFVLEGEIWNVTFEGQTAQFPDLKGFHDLARLLGKPRQSVHCTDLMGAQVLEQGTEVFDEKARAAYQKRILELQDAMENASKSLQSERLEALQEEYEELIDHLSKAVGKGGRARKVSGTVEKTRSAVTWRIRSAIKKITEAHPALGKHLKVSVKTGVFCEYSPERDTPWML